MLAFRVCKMPELIDRPVAATVMKMAIPMLAGTFATNMYQLTDAWMVSRLGTEALAAISFTFPVIMFFSFLIRGLGTGTMTLVAHALGGDDRAGATTLIYHAILLAGLIALVLMTAGLISLKPLFNALGASGSVLVRVEEYMKIWYMGCMIMILQMVTSDVIFATGNTGVMSALMVGGTVVNIIFDYVLIFGKYGFPRLEMAGAALATLIAQTMVLVAALVILRKKMGLLHRRGHEVSILSSWSKIMAFSIPGSLGMVATPVSAAIVTRLVAEYGHAAVAATGVAGRIEMFAFMIPMAVGMSLIPFIAQNFGANRMDRIREARRGTMIFAVLYGVFIGAVFIASAGSMARVFSSDASVVEVLRSYIYITCAGYGMMEVHRYAGFCMTGTNQPFKASMLNVFRALVLLIPLSLMGNHLFKLNGIFGARCLTDLLAGMIGIWWSGRMLKRVQNQMRTVQSQDSQP